MGKRRPKSHDRKSKGAAGRSNGRFEASFLLGLPRTGRTYIATGLGIAAAHPGQRILCAPNDRMGHRLADTHCAARLPEELARLRRYRLIIVHVVGDPPFGQAAGHLFFPVVGSRCEHASLRRPPTCPPAARAVCSATKP